MEQFIETIFSDALAPERRLCIFTAPDLRAEFFADAASAALHARAVAPARDVYFGLGLVKGTPPGRGKAEDVAAIGALWADIDLASPAHEGKTLPASIEDVWRLLAKLPLVPSMLVHSGFGVHAYWLLKEPWVFDSAAERADAVRLTKGWHAAVCTAAQSLGWHLENLGDLARVLRLPGTLNHKSTPPAEVRVIDSGPDLRYNPSDFEPYLVDEPVPVAPAQVGPLTLKADAHPPLDKMVEAAANSPKFRDTWHRDRPDLADQSQSGYDLALASIAARLGWKDQEIADLIIAARRHHGRRPEKALRADYVTRTLAKARASSADLDAEGPDVDLSAFVGPGAGGPDESGPPAPTSPGPFPIELIDRAPDIVKRAMDYYMASAVEVQPVLFLGSFISATGAILGHKVQDASGLRTNIYTVGISPSGGGKEATRETIRKVFAHAGIARMCGPEDFASDSGLIAAVVEQNPILFQLDEFGRLMHSVNAGSGRSPHLYNIASALLKFYSKAGSVFRSKAYADPKRNVEIDQPHVCLYGTTVRMNFWKAMDADSLEGGFLPRLLIIESADDSLPGGATASDPPRETVDFFTFWAQKKTTNGNLEHVNPRPLVVPYTPDATALMNDLRQLQKTEQKRHGDLGALWSRARENAGKLALIHACWKNCLAPEVDAQAAQWAIDLVTHVVRHCLYEAHLCMSEGTFHERCQKIMRALEQAEGRELSRSALTRATRNMTPRERDEAAWTLKEQGRLTIGEKTTGGRPGTWYRAV